MPCSLYSGMPNLVGEIGVYRFLIIVGEFPKGEKGLVIEICNGITTCFRRIVQHDGLDADASVGDSINRVWKSVQLIIQTDLSSVCKTDFFQGFGFGIFAIKRRFKGGIGIIAIGFHKTEHVCHDSSFGRKRVVIHGNCIKRDRILS